MKKQVEKTHTHFSPEILEALRQVGSICVLGKPDKRSFYTQDIIHHIRLDHNTIFVFGSNIAGIHGCGAALQAKLQYGANQFCGRGLRGKSYAIPTKNSKFQTLPLKEIAKNVKEFVDFTKEHPELSFYVTPVGTGYAGVPDSKMAPMFQDAKNCWFHARWRRWFI